MNNRMLRINKQGKQISQMISYIWRWADDDTQTEKRENARHLKEYFEGSIKRHSKQHIDSDLCAADEDFNSERSANWKYPVDLGLFSADPKQWLKEKKDTTPTEAVKLLIAVFGEERILHDKNFLSPLFSTNELKHYRHDDNDNDNDNDKKDEFRYKFFLNPDSFLGALEDPEFSLEIKFLKFIIGYPPAPKFGGSTVTEGDLEDWIKNDSPDQCFPNHIYIPVSTS